jgi:hypothetical protein
MHGSVWVGVAAGVAALAASIGGSVADTPRPPARPLVVELFTSEGCSSCPPADALLSDLARSRPDVLPLAFHITYWDGLGWRDPFALRAATDRQRNYAATLGLDGIYTPQMVVEGRQDVIGSDRASVLAALRQAAAALPPPVPLHLVRAGGLVTLEIGEGGRVRQGSVLLVGYDSAHQTAVARGENAGRTLTESNIVRGLARVGDWHGAPMTVQAAPPAGERIAAILQAPDGQILGAARLE